uniref:uncharacterized protein LOC122589607 isoform X1 n=1 Tax=Erigeron canadensis TaxID=72917 RepID=UPI001CB99F44|nr:uncharacterized protein LOC122589607 isoform X1 [Erigeron canadensis]XP_043617853.1 uncharacterized protein LOC122589607 isoform X1 [Erigeron canadensis]
MGDVTGKTNGSTVKNKAGKETENGQPNMEVIFGEMLWVKLDQGSWWPAQVVDDNSISLAYKPSSKGSKSDVLVRLYGSYTYNYVDIHGSRAEFKDILMKKNFNYESIFKETLEQDLPSLKSSRSKKRQSNSKDSYFFLIKCMSVSELGIDNVVCLSSQDHKRIYRINPRFQAKNLSLLNLNLKLQIPRQMGCTMNHLLQTMKAVLVD